MNAQILRAPIFHTPRPNHLEFFADGGLLIRDGLIEACGDYSAVALPDIPVRDLRGGYLLPGFVDTHIHFPQVRALGGLGHRLLDWLDSVALPEEARMADAAYARDTARRFVRALISHGTRTALVFGSHFKDATAALFEEAEHAGLRLVSGLVVSDRNLRPDLHQTPDAAWRDSSELIARYHGRARLRYAVTPRFALSASEAMLEVCQTLLREHPDVQAQSHINESPAEIEETARLFPWASDYFEIYERYGLARPGTVLAHSVHTTDSELRRMAASGIAVSHCPCSNAMLGSGLFPFARHQRADVRVALGTDVGGGAGFGILKEALQAYAMQRVAPEGLLLGPAHLLYLATLAGAEALGLDGETGSFEPGKSADFVYIRPKPESVLEGVLERASSAESILSILFTLAGEESIEEVTL